MHKFKTIFSVVLSFVFKEPGFILIFLVLFINISADVMENFQSFSLDFSCFFILSILSLFSTCSSVGSPGLQLEPGGPDVSFYSHLFQVFWDNYKAFPDKPRDMRPFCTARPGPGRPGFKQGFSLFALAVLAPSTPIFSTLRSEVLFGTGCSIWYDVSCCCSLTGSLTGGEGLCDVTQMRVTLCESFATTVTF